MLGVESKPNDSERFKSENHESALDKMGYRSLFGTSLGAGLNPALGASLGAEFNASISASLGSLGNNFSREERQKESNVELVKPTLVYDIASLILYKCEALPIRLKIALDRLFSVLTHEEVLQVLHGFGWSYEDYARGYKLQDRNGSPLLKWNMVTPEDESALLQKFLRFGETKNIVQQLIQHDSTLPRIDSVARNIREARDLRESKSNREFREGYRERERDREHREKDYSRKDELKNFAQKSLHNHSQQNSQLPLHSFPDPTKPIDQEHIKKLLERNMLFNPFMRGPTDPASLLRATHPSNLHNLSPTSPLSSLLAVNPSLASSILANPQLASSLSMLRLPVPPVSVSNLSPNNVTAPSSFGRSTSPLGGSPLNRLQSMQVFDFRKERKSPSPMQQTHMDVSNSSANMRPASAAATSPNSITSTGSIGGVSPSPNNGINHNSTDLSVAIERNDHFSDDEDSSSVSSSALNLSTSTTTVVSPTHTPIGMGPCPTSLSAPLKPTTPTALGPATPPKRSFNPINMGSAFINPVTGKKRVQCNVCLKTFCDKGALKIHFSAVHLREMHKCTIEGCSMMFSSRRSRNRHSANPNPKLHTPHIRRKISPHDGRTASGHPVILPNSFQQQLSQGLQQHAGFPPLTGFPNQFGTLNPLTGLPFMPPTSDLHKQALELHRQNFDMHNMRKSPVDNNSRSHEDLYRFGSIPLTPSYDDKPDIDRRDRGSKNGNGEEEDDSMSVDHSLKDGAPVSPTTNKRKRKSQNPTKFAFRLEDDDLISTDDDDDDDDLDDTKDSEEDKNEDKELDAMSDDDDEDIHMKEGDKLSNGNNEINKYPGFDENGDASSALRHLEDLSKGAFNSTRLSPVNQYQENSDRLSSPKSNEGDRESEDDYRNEELENNLHYSEGFLSNVDIPTDKENPNRCVSCGKMFQNHFSVKIHYQNVHLKLLHKCTVEGCNAAFPSKRSRDRHSININLHRKLLSTTEISQGGFPGINLTGLPFGTGMSPELLARLCTDNTPFTLEALKSQLPAAMADSLFNVNKSYGANIPTSNAPKQPFFLRNLLPHLASNNSQKEKSRTPSPQSTTLSSSESYFPVSSSSDHNSKHETVEEKKYNPSLDYFNYNLEEDLPTPDRDGNMPCKFCSQSFTDGDQLKNHYESNHTADMFRCSAEGCGKLYSSRRKKNNHELNCHPVLGSDT